MKQQQHRHHRKNRCLCWQRSMLFCPSNYLLINKFPILSSILCSHIRTYHCTVICVLSSNRFFPSHVIEERTIQQVSSSTVLNSCARRLFDDDQMRSLKSQKASDELENTRTKSMIIYDNDEVTSYFRTSIQQCNLGSFRRAVSTHIIIIVNSNTVNTLTASLSFFFIIM